MISRSILASLRRISSFIAAAFVLFSTGFGCTADTEQAAQEVVVEPEALYFEPIGYGQRAAIQDTIEAVFRDREEWTAFRDSLRPVAAFDSVDFSQANVLLAALPQVTSGYSIDFISVDLTDSVVVAEYMVEVPSEDCLTAYAESVPFQAVLVRKTDQPVRFVRSEEEYRCTFGPRRR